MILTKCLAYSLLASTGVVTAGWLSQQNAVTIAGVISTVGVAIVSVYQNFRKKKHEADEADLKLAADRLKLTAESDRSRADQLADTVMVLTNQLETAKAEAHEWLTLYRSLVPDPGLTTPLPAGPTPTTHPTGPTP